MNKSSFTLIELLIVIGILAILTAAVVIVLNPTELLKQGRDSTRMTDLASLSKTIQLLLTQNPSLSLGTASTVYVSLFDNSSSTCGSLGLPTLPSGYVYNCVSGASSTLVNGQGWLPIDFTSTIQSIPRLPIDPVNTSSTGMYYAYIPNPSAKTYELTSSVESNKYISRGGADGGATPFAFEIGSDLSLTPSVVLGNGATYDQLTTKDTSLVGYWKLDEGSGLSALDSKNSNTGTISGATWTSGANCKIGSCLVFSSTMSTNVRGTLSPVIPTNGDYTEVAWIYPTIAVTGAIIDDYNNAEHYLNYNSSGTIIGNYYNNTFGHKYAQSITTVPLNVWSCVAVSVSSGNYIRVYYNGILIAENNNLSGVPTKIFDDFVFGQWGAGGTKFEGRIDETRIYGRALSGGEILSLYNATK